VPAATEPAELLAKSAAKSNVCGMAKALGTRGEKVADPLNMLLLLLALLLIELFNKQGPLGVIGLMHGLQTTSAPLSADSSACTGL